MQNTIKDALAILLATQAARTPHGRASGTINLALPLVCITITINAE